MWLTDILSNPDLKHFQIFPNYTLPGSGSHFQFCLILIYSSVLEWVIQVTSVKFSLANLLSLTLKFPLFLNTLHVFNLMLYKWHTNRAKFMIKCSSFFFLGRSPRKFIIFLCDHTSTVLHYAHMVYNRVSAWNTS